MGKYEALKEEIAREYAWAKEEAAGSDEDLAAFNQGVVFAYELLMKAIPDIEGREA